MELSDLNKEDRAFMESLVLLENTDRIGYLCVVCMIASITPIVDPSAILSMLKNTSKGDFKRAVKCLRCSQAAGYPYRETIERTIDYIRREWLRKEVKA